MLIISPEQLISAGRIAADCTRIELRYTIGRISIMQRMYNATKYKPYRNKLAALKRRKTKLEQTLLVLKHIYL
jgi:hypothetical protein